MKYISTRGQSDEKTFTEAVATGLAPDGGLYLPKTLPNIAPRLKQWADLSYPDLCFEFMKLFATDMLEDKLRTIVDASYSNFSRKEIAPLVKLDGHLSVLELFHGPTLAFKDFALQLLGNLYEEQIERTGDPINVLGATSGDTGSAAIHGLLGKKGVRIFILYPQGRVSMLQERQMTTTAERNVYPIAIEGSFDDAQAMVKDAFGDANLKARYSLSAINSINLARILAQCVYYIWAWLQLDEDARKRGVQFVVPTGNFGNVLAGWLTREMGLPIEGFRVATNQNDILCRLFNTGHYEVTAVEPSVAPSMDIQVASNFERFLYYSVGQDPERVRTVMEQFKAKGKYTFEDFDRSAFSATRMDDKEIHETIESIYGRYKYVADPHTACAFKDLDESKTNIVLATAHPAKFPEVIEEALGRTPTAPSLEAIKNEPIVNYMLPAEGEALAEFLKEHAKGSE
ncbi:threonine synthase [Cerasicoccus arenae]|uniref:Threonine synthase n=1 Tax=Cerasicoccus arenae TaxID=424488 RepID=A0A8J3GEB3_9BACT|nr:threonine synthase [Cerasicoccus arenae]MBK1859926.1 threonine synthase [Cerasicoccus arenae]GHC13002.1 threonine synthase [Cerasicoccus arenae]